MRLSHIGYIIVIFFIAGSCKNEEKHLFSLLDSNSTGIYFKNTLKESESANVLNYAYFYNGGGVAIGDINNDGLPDILFTGNMVSNRLYLNKGNFQFEDITEKSGIGAMQGWCTGATMADVNGDGRLDIYICRSADANPARRKNLLFINNGDLTFTEKAGSYGLADEGYSTQAAFFDYDKDGDLDMILINHSLQEYANGSYENINLRTKKDPSFAIKLYRNDIGHFTEVSEQAGITSNVLSFGLGLAISDINNDGWPDVYISNDFNEPDYLFINNRNGTFSEKLKGCMDETSLYSMGSDCADFNNDGLPDLVTLDMLDESNHLQKMHNGAENFDKFEMLFRNGFYYQYNRNMLQKNNGDGTFSEIGQLAGISNTSWSWSALFSDFDNDGYKDLFVTNGYPKDNTNMDFIKYRMISQNSLTDGASAQKNLLEKMPSLKMPNYIFQNNGNSTFTEKIKQWGLNQGTLSSGAAYADLDNDGNMDLVINNINQEASVYKNNGSMTLGQNHYLKIALKGKKNNTFGIGAKIKLYCGDRLYYQEQFPVRGFQSSVDPVLNFGIGKYSSVDSLVVIWPDDRTQKLTNIKSNQLITLKWAGADLLWKYDSTQTHPAYFTKASSVNFVHKEKPFNDFTVQTLLINYLSRQGPCMAKTDINKDGKEDLFIGGGAGQPSQIFIQTPTGDFIKRSEPDIEKDSVSGVVAAEFFDADNDGNIDLYIASGGYQFNENSAILQDRLYLNDGHGNFKKSIKALPQLIYSKGCVKAADINGDGFMDLFIGGRVVPGKYPLPPQSKILVNDGKGNFMDETKVICPALTNIGMVTDALWIDLNGDNKKDLIIVGEWMPIKVFINENGKLMDHSSQYIKFPSFGWWNRILAADFNGDGKLDLVIGNTGLNTQFKASVHEPVTLYYKDFDGNGSLDPVLCYYIHDTSYPAVSRDDLVEQLPMLKKKFLEYHSYADATINDIFSEEQFKSAVMLKANMMETIFLQNNGTEGFLLKPLPLEAQYAPVFAIAAADVNHDGKPDMILAGNNSWTRIKFGRYRANHGVVLLGDGKGNFTYSQQAQSGLNLRDDVRSVELFHAGIDSQLIFGVNDDSVKSYKINH